MHLDQAGLIPEVQEVQEDQVHLVQVVHGHNPEEVGGQVIQEEVDIQEDQVHQVHLHHLDHGWKWWIR